MKHINILLLVVILSMTGLSFANPLTVAAKLAVVDGLITDKMNEATDNANYVVFEGASQLKLVIENLRLSLNDVLDKSFDSLDASQKEIFNNINVSIANMEQAISLPIEEARQSLELTQQIIADIKLGDGVSITRAYPSVLSPSNHREIVYTVRGVSLDSSDPSLLINGTKVRRIGLEKQQARFSIPTGLFKFNKSNVVVNRGKVNVTVNKCRAFIFCKNVNKSFEISILTLPKEIATIDLTYRTKKEKIIFHNKKFSKKFQQTTGSIHKYKCRKFSQGAHRPGFFIDTSTLKPTNYVKTGKCPPSGTFGRLFLGCKKGQTTYRHTKKGAFGRAGHRWKLLSQNSAGFTVELCAKSQINRGRKKTGEMHLNMSWREYHNGDIVSNAISVEKNKPLLWRHSYRKPLPKDTNSFNLVINYFDGTSTIVDGSYKDSFIDVSWNNSSKNLIIRPQKNQGVKSLF